MITCEACLKRARGLLNDTTVGAYRWTDDELLSFLNASLDDFFAARSDMLVKPNGRNATPEESMFTDLSGAVDFLPQKYADAIAYGCAARAFELDDSDIKNIESAARCHARAQQERMK